LLFQRRIFVVFVRKLRVGIWRFTGYALFSDAIRPYVYCTDWYFTIA